MRRLGLLLAVLISVTTIFCGCSFSDTTQVKSGCYLAVSKNPDSATGNQDSIALEPYVFLDTEDNSFSYGPSLYASYMEYGTYEIDGEKLIATTQNETTYTFEIKDENTLAIIDNEGKILEEFVYTETK